MRRDNLERTELGHRTKIYLASKTLRDILVNLGLEPSLLSLQYREIILVILGLEPSSLSLQY